MKIVVGALLLTVAAFPLDFVESRPSGQEGSSNNHNNNTPGNNEEDDELDLMAYINGLHQPRERTYDLHRKHGLKCTETFKPPGGGHIQLDFGNLRGLTRGPPVAPPRIPSPPRSPMHSYQEDSTSTLTSLSSSSNTRHLDREVSSSSLARLFSPSGSSRFSDGVDSSSASPLFSPSGSSRFSDGVDSSTSSPLFSPSASSRRLNRVSSLSSSSLSSPSTPRRSNRPHRQGDPPRGDNL